MQEGTKPTFSIVIPVKDDSAHIARSTKSVLSQGEDYDFELVVVDDCSQDGTSELVSLIAERDERVKSFRAPMPLNCGGARNFGVEKAANDYIVFLDSDDYLLEGAIKAIGDQIVSAGLPDCVSIPFKVLHKTGPETITKVQAKDLQSSALGPVAPWAQVIKKDKFVPFPVGTLSEDTAWHFLQFDQFETWTKVDGDPCLVYDRTNRSAITETVEWCGKHSVTLEQLAFGTDGNLGTNEIERAGLRDKWISDVLRNYANMYDVRHDLRKPWVKKAWAVRFRNEISNLMTGHFCH